MNPIPTPHSTPLHEGLGIVSFGPDLTVFGGCNILICEVLTHMLTELEIKQLVVDHIRTIFTERRKVIVKILLFGSRARGNQRFDSDWDFLIVTENELPWSEKKEIWRTISRSLAKYHISADILIKSQRQFDFDAEDKGKVTYYAKHEGSFV